MLADVGTEDVGRPLALRIGNPAAGILDQPAVFCHLDAAHHAARQQQGRPAEHPGGLTQHHRISVGVNLKGREGLLSLGRWMTSSVSPLGAVRARPAVPVRAGGGARKGKRSGGVPVAEHSQQGGVHVVRRRCARLLVRPKFLDPPVVPDSDLKYNKIYSCTRVMSNNNKKIMRLLVVWTTYTGLFIHS